MLIGRQFHGKSSSRRLIEYLAHSLADRMQFASSLPANLPVRTDRGLCSTKQVCEKWTLAHQGEKASLTFMGSPITGMVRSVNENGSGTLKSWIITVVGGITAGTTSGAA
jgi:hypothetical protein